MHVFRQHLEIRKGDVVLVGIRDRNLQYVILKGCGHSVTGKSRRDNLSQDDTAYRIKPLTPNTHMLNRVTNQFYSVSMTVHFLFSEGVSVSVCVCVSEAR